MNCRHCSNPLRIPYLNLGSAPPSNAYLTRVMTQAPETYFPLQIMVCDQCWLVQTIDYAGRETLFTDDYAYFSSFSDSWLFHARSYVRDMIDRFNLDADSCVVEVGSNDGYLLQYFKSAGVCCYGIEPTKSTAASARAKGIDTVEAFFGVKLAQGLAKKKRPADLMIANNVLAHVPDINDFVSGFVELLKPHGIATFEFPHLLKMVDENQFDTAYHEHYSYLSLTAVQKIFQQNGLSIFDIEELSTHGGSLRVFAQRSASGLQVRALSVDQLLMYERNRGLERSEFYRTAQRRAENAKNHLLKFLIDVKQNGQRISAYGAAAKGNTLLNFAGIRADLIPYVVDRNPSKIGKYLPGSHIPIVEESVLKNDKPDYVLIFPWNLKLEISQQLSYIKDWHGKIVTAIPILEIMS